jgi:hypothetical protein
LFTLVPLEEFESPFNILEGCCISIYAIRAFFGCKDGTAPSSQDSQSCTSLKSFEHHIGGKNQNRTESDYSNISLSRRIQHHVDLLSILYLVVESNHCQLHVKQLRYHYANEAILVFLTLYSNLKFKNLTT